MSVNVETAFASHVVDLVKSAAGQTGQAEKYMPWYGAAGLGAIGHTLGPKALPKKFKLLGEVAGTLGGTYAGVHGGEVVGRAMDKRAEEVPVEPQPEKPDYNKVLRRIAMRQAGTTLKEIGATTLPVAAGMGTGYAIQKYLEHTGRSAAPVAKKILGYSALPAVGLAAGLAYRTANNLKENEFARIREEETHRYNQAMRDWEQNLKRTPVPESAP